MEIEEVSFISYTSKNKKGEGIFLDKSAELNESVFVSFSFFSSDGVILAERAQKLKRCISFG